ncbi:hypothetical protein [Paraburkholderia terrae]
MEHAVSEHAVFAVPPQGIRHYPTRTGCGDRHDGRRANICLLVPADRTAMDARGRDNGGTRGHVNIRAPCVGLVPTGAELTAADDDPQGLVIALDPCILETTLRRVFGSSRRELKLWLQVWDPFLREAASTLMSLAQTAVAEDGGLDAFADAIACTSRTITAVTSAHAIMKKRRSATRNWC